jgi:hypothetical protein
MLRQTWFACIICVLGVLPGLIAGALAGILYRAFNASYLGGEPDFFMLRTLFGIEAPSKFVGWLFNGAFPAAIHGGFAGAVAMWLTGIICKGARYDTAAWVTGGLYSGVVIVIVILSLIIQGPNVGAVEFICQLIGLWLGLTMVLETLPRHVPAAE